MATESHVVLIFVDILAWIHFPNFLSFIYTEMVGEFDIFVMADKDQFILYI